MKEQIKQLLQWCSFFPHHTSFNKIAHRTSNKPVLIKMNGYFTTFFTKYFSDTTFHFFSPLSQVLLGVVAF